MRRKISILGLAGLVVTTSAYAAPLSVGVVPQNGVDATTKAWQPIVDEIARRAGVELRLSVAETMAEFDKHVAAGAYDIAYMNPFQLLLARASQAYEPVVRDGATDLAGILVVRKDAGISRVEDLANKTIAFPSPNALGASLLMRAQLDHQYKLAFKAVYSGTHPAAYRAVIDGSVAAAGGVPATLDAQPPEIRDQLIVLFKTTSVDPHPVAIHPRVGIPTRDAVRRAFIDMGGDASGAKLLAAVPMTRVVAASLDDYRRLQRWGLQSYYVREQSAAK